MKVGEREKKFTKTVTFICDNCEGFCEKNIALSDVKVDNEICCICRGDAFHCNTCVSRKA